MARRNLARKVLEKPTRLESDARRAQLLERGKELFRTRSYDEISIDDIAGAAGVSKGLLYHYFPGKRSYYVATVRAAVAEMLTLTHGNPKAPGEAALRQGIESYLDYVANNAKAYAALLRSGVGTDAEVALIVDETRAVTMKRVARALGLDLQIGPVRLALRGWIGYVEATAISWSEKTEVSRDALVASFLVVLEAAVTSLRPSR